MIITVWFHDRQVQAVCPDLALIFDGSSWVAPAVGEYAALLVTKPTVTERYPYEIEELPQPYGYMVDTKYLCLITEVSVEASSDLVLESSIDPAGGACLCLVCATATQILNVKVN